MPILEQVDLAAKRSEPMVWISKIALFETLQPLVPIREPIKFSTGLNIVWGVESESTDEDFEPGHGVGKTTLCRLIRYCLGEPNYGQAHAAKEIAHTFPDGCVAAEVHVQGQRWAVLRPFNKTRADWAQADVSIAELIENHPTKASFHEYLERISAVCLDGIRTDGVLTDGASIQWPHLLAMCSRDQEARYQSLWQWRSPRSDSVPRNIQKEDAHLILRSVLKLLPDEETSLQQKLARFASDLLQIEKDIAERVREPDYWNRHYRQSLRRDFSIDEALNASLDLADIFGLPHVVDRKIQSLDAEQKDRLNRLGELDRKIGLTAASLLERGELQEQQQVTAQVTDTGTDALMASLEELRRLRQLIRDAEYSFCDYGQVSVGNCRHSQEQLITIDQQLQDASQLQSPIAAQRDQASSKLREQVRRRSELIGKISDDLEQLNKERRGLDDERRAVQNQITAMRKAMDRLLDWEKLRTGNEPDSELAELQKRKQDIETDLTGAKQELTKLLASQDKSLKGLRAVYEALVRSTLSSDFNGRVQLTSEGLEFRIFRGENLSGEAFETLSILLADIAVMVLGATGTATHPGMLIHDSPREADLGGQIYRRLFSCSADVAKALSGSNVVPFQHIITTTTPPPTALRKKRSTRLKLGGEAGQLFGKQLHAAARDNQSDLPFGKEDAAGGADEK